MGTSIAAKQAAIIGSSIVKLGGHLDDQHDAGDRSLHHPGEERRHADNRESDRVEVHVGESDAAEDAAEPSELRSQHENRGEEAARHRRRVRHWAEAKAQKQRQWKHCQSAPPASDALRDVVTAADQLGRETGKRADCRTDDWPHEFRPASGRGGPSLQVLPAAPVVELCRQPGDSAQRDEERPDLDSDISERLDLEVRRGAEKGASDGDRGRGGAQCGDRDACVEPPHQLFEHEDRTGDRRVESGGETGAGTRRDQHLAVVPVAAEQFADDMGDRRAHLYARAFATERQPGADCREPAKEFHEQQTRRRRRQLVIQNFLDLRNAAPRSVRREPPNQPGGDRNGGGTAGRNAEEPSEVPAVSRGDRGITKPIGRCERKPKERPDQPGGAADDRSQERQHQ